MSSINPQFQADRSAFLKWAKQDGLDIQQIQQKAISALPSTATQQQKDDAIQAATLQAVSQTNDKTLSQSYQQLQNDHQQQLQNQPGGAPQAGGKKGPPPGGGPGGDTSATTIISEGDKASVSEIQSCLSTMKSNDPNYATLNSMLQAAQAKEQKNPHQQQSPPEGNVLNFMS
jgi:hypothetical protein